MAVFDHSPPEPIGSIYFDKANSVIGTLCSRLRGWIIVHNTRLALNSLTARQIRDIRIARDRVDSQLPGVGI